jgi:hypothetical protein
MQFSRTLLQVGAVNSVLVEIVKPSVADDSPVMSFVLFAVSICSFVGVSVVLPS